MQVTRVIPSSEFRTNFADALKTVVYGGEVIGITMHGKLIAALVPVKDTEKEKK